MPRIDTLHTWAGWFAWAVNDYGEKGPVRWGPTASMAVSRAARAEARRWDALGHKEP
jgi:hypothetical protein